MARRLLCAGYLYARSFTTFWSNIMTWTKPEAEIVAVTMEVTAYVATL